MSKITFTISGTDLGDVTHELHMNEAFTKATIGWALDTYHDEELDGPKDPTDMAQLSAVTKRALTGTAKGMEANVRRYVQEKAKADAAAAAAAAEAAMAVEEVTP